MNFFLPKQVFFFELLKELNGSISEISVLFQNLSKEFKDFEEFSKKAEYIEHKADNKAHEIIDRLNKTFITPIDREDIYLLTNELDDIVDLVENVIHNIQLYKIEHNLPAFVKFSELIVQASACLEQLLDCLEYGKHTQELTKLKIKMHELEDQADWVFESAISKLFTDHTDAVTIIKLKDILENLEHIMNKFQKVADVIEGIIVKSN